MNPKFPSTTCLLGAAVAAATLLGSPALANQPVIAAEAVHQMDVSLQPEVASAPAPAPIIVVAKRKSPMLTNAELDEQRGGETLVVANQTLTAITQGNVLNGDFVAGNVSLTDSALSNFNGVGNIVINTGAQVSLQSGMNLTINLGE